MDGHRAARKDGIQNPAYRSTRRHHDLLKALICPLTSTFVLSGTPRERPPVTGKVLNSEDFLRT